MADLYKHGSFLIPQPPTPVQGYIYFDAVMTETVTRDADVTEFPVEVGANITDHYRLKLNSIKLDCFVSQEPIGTSVHPEGQGFYGAQAISWQPYPSLGIVNNVATALTNPVGSLLRLINTDPTSATLNNVLQFAQPFDSLTTLLGQLESLRNAATIVDVATRSYYYAGYMLGQIETSRDKGTGSGTKISIELHQINQVATQQVGAPPVPKKPKDTPPVNKGAQQPTDPGQMTSGAKALANLIGLGGS